MIGNPVTDDPDYRDFTVATLPQLEKLDGKEIERSERIIALQRLPAIRKRYVEEAEARGDDSEEEEESESEDEEDEESEEEEEDMIQFQKRALPDHVSGGKLDNYWATEREKSYGGKFRFVRNADETPEKGMIVAIQVDLRQFEATVAAASCRTMSVIMEGPLVADTENNMAGSRFGCVVKCQMEQRAVASLLGEWMCVMERQKKRWVVNSLKPLEEVKAAAENPEKYRVNQQPKAKKSEMTKNTPKDRLMLAREQAEEKAAKEGPNEKAERERAKAEKLAAFEEERRLAAQACCKGDACKFKDRPRQRNEAKLEFYIDGDQKDRVILELAVPKFLDTSAIDIDVQPTWVAIAVKSKEFLIHTPAEVNPDQTKAERSVGTGALVLTMPKVGQIIKAPEIEDRPTKLETITRDKRAAEKLAAASTDLTDGAIGKTKATVNLNVIEASEEEKKLRQQKSQEELAAAWAPKKKRGVTKEVSPNFVDNLDVPPLE